MTDRLRILHLEDSPDDAELIREVLRSGGMDCEIHRVETREAFESELGKNYDVVLADYSLPAFDGLSALKITRNRYPDLPFILISGTVGEELAVAALKEGATDYIMKERTSRLPFAIRHALTELAQLAERKRVQEEKEKLLRAVEQTGDLVIITNRDGMIEYVNHAFELVTGYQKSEAIGTTPKLLKSGRHNQEFYRHLWHSISSGQMFKTVFTNRKKNGQLYYEEQTIAPIRNEKGEITHYVSTGKDITEAKKAEEELLKSQQRFKQIAETISEVFWLADGNMKQVDYVSAAYVKIWGRARESLTSGTEPFIDTIHPEDRSLVERFLAEHGPQHKYELEFRIVRPDGSIRWIRNRGFPVRDQGGKVFRFTGIAQDITEKKSSEEEMTQLTRQLHQAQKMEAIGQLAGGVAHDFNNILMAMGGFSELLLMKMNPIDPLRQEVLQLQKAAQQGAELTRQLLAFSRKQVLSPKVLSLVSSVSKMKEMMQRLIGEDIELETHFAPGLGRIEADPSQIDQVLMNLVVNARDAMPNGGKLTIEASNVKLDASFAEKHFDVKPGSYVMLAVSDSGHGMDEATLSRVFEPFFTTKQEGKGTGLGLSTVYGIVKQSGGSINVYSQVGHGTTFKIYFPEIEKTAKDSVSLPRSTLNMPGEGRTVLITDDNFAVRSALAGVLELNGFHVLQASRGGEAIQKVESYSGKIDLLISDVIMPEMNGVDLVRVIKGMVPDIKIILMSGYTEEAVKRQGLLEKGATFLSKPVTMKTLLTTISDLLLQT